jgi:hypothetical protein
VFLHYSGYPPLRYGFTVCHQILMDPLGAVTFLAGFEERPDLREQIQIPKITFSQTLISGRLAAQKAVKPASG